MQKIEDNSEEIKNLAQGIRLIKGNSNTNKADVQKHWYQGSERYFDIFINLKNDEIDWVQVTLRGHYLEWKKNNRHLQTGTTNEFVVESKSGHPGSKIMSSDREINLQFIRLVNLILQQVPEDDILKKVLGILQG